MVPKTTYIHHTRANERVISRLRHEAERWDANTTGAVMIRRPAVLWGDSPQFSRVPRASPPR